MDVERFPSSDLRVHHAYLERLARTLASNASDADDIVQEVWLSLLERPPQHFDRFRGWLRVAAVHTATRLRIRRRARRVRDERSARPESLPSTFEEFERMTFLDELVEAVGRLDEPYREVVRLRYLQDVAIHEIASQLDRPQGTVRSQLKRGLDRMRDGLDRRYGDRRTWAGLVLSLPRTVADLRAPSRSSADRVVDEGRAPGGGARAARGRAGEESVAAMRRGLPSIAALAAGLLLCLVFLALDERESVADAPARFPSAYAAQASASGVSEPGGRIAAERSSAPATVDVTNAALVLHTIAPDGGALGGIDALVERIAIDPEGRWVSTNGDGVVHVDDLAAGPVRVTPLRGDPVDVELVAGATTEVTLTLPDARDVEVEVVDRHGRPVANAELLVAPVGRPDVPRAVGRTSATGSTVVRGLDLDARVAASAPGMLPSNLLVVRSAVRSAGERRTLTLTLPGAASRCAGVVVDARGEPVAGATVRLDGEFDARPLLGPSGVAQRIDASEGVTDANGRFELAYDATSPARLRVEAEGFAPRSVRLESTTGSSVPDARVVLSANETLDATTSAEEVAARARSVVEGRLVDRTGAPLVGWAIAYEDAAHAARRLQAPYDVAPRVRALRTSDADGRFAFELDASPDLEGALFAYPDLGAARRGAFPHAAARRVHPVDRTDASGGASADRAQTLELVVATGRDAARERGRLEASILCDPSRLEGAFVVAGSGSVPGNAFAEFEPGSTSFAFDALPGGEVDLWLHAPGVVPYRLASVVVHPGVARRLDPIVLPAMESVVLVPFGPGGERVALDGTLLAIGEGVELNSGYDARAFRDLGSGEVESAPLWPGDYRFAVVADGFETTHVSFEVVEGRATRVEVPVARGVPVAVDVVLDEGAEVDAHELLVRLDVTDDEGALVLRRQARVERLGSLLYSTRFELAEGVYDLAAHASDGRTAKARVATNDLIASERVRLTFR